MQIPDSFKNKIAQAFFDKTLIKCEIVETKNLDGEVILAAEATEDVIMGNVSFDKLDRIQQQYGLEEQIDMTFTTHDVMANDEVYSYLDIKYKVYRAIPFDSHYFILLKKWYSKSSILPSA